jgi:hypothetical protein
MKLPTKLRRGPMKRTTKRLFERLKIAMASERTLRAELRFALTVEALLIQRLRLRGVRPLAIGRELSRFWADRPTTEEEGRRMMRRLFKVAARHGRTRTMHHER